MGKRHAPDGKRRIDTGNSALVGCQDAIRGATRGKPPVSQSWHGFATLGLQRHFFMMLARSSGAMEKWALPFSWAAA